MERYTDMSRRELLDELVKKERLAAENLASLEGRFRNLLAGMNVGFAEGEIICDEAGIPCDYRILFANPVFLKETSLEAGDLKNKTARGMFPASHDWWIKTYGKVALTGESVRFQRFGRKTQRHYEVFASSSVRGRFCLVAKDISERKRTEEALREKEAHFNAVTEGVDGMMYVCSPEYRIESHNEAMRRRVGRDATGELCYRALYDLDAVCPWCVNDRVFAEESVRWTMQSLKDKRWYEVSSIPVRDERGGVSRKQVLIADVTERKQLEEALFRSKQELELSNELLEQKVTERTADLLEAVRAQESFSYSVSHDLRAPLRHMNSFSEVLLEDYGALLPPKAREYLHRITAASSKMGSLIDHLLELSRVGRAELKMERVDLSDLASSTLLMFKETHPERRVEQLVERGIVVPGDAALLQQLLVNLLGNAWKYTSGKPYGCIQFGTTLVSGEQACFVRDNGAGFDMRYRDKLFRAFERLHGAEFEGVGIGLATAQRIVERHGGRIWSDARVDEGATFYFCLPGMARPDGPCDQGHGGLACSSA